MIYLLKEVVIFYGNVKLPEGIPNIPIKSPI